MQIGRMTSILSLKTRNKKNLFSNSSFVFFIILSITLIFFDVKNIIKPSVIRSIIVNSIFLTKDFFVSNIPNIDKLKLLFVPKDDLVLEIKYLRKKIEESNLYRLKSGKLEIENNILKKENNAIYIDSINDLSQIQYINIYVNQFKNF